MMGIGEMKMGKMQMSVWLQAFRSPESAILKTQDEMPVTWNHNYYHKYSIY